MVELELDVSGPITLSNGADRLRSGWHDNLSIALVVVFDDRDHGLLNRSRNYRRQPSREPIAVPRSNVGAA